MTPAWIKADSRRIFGFGSNESGWHGAGAARTAMDMGAVYGEPEGEFGQTYALPTKSKGIKRTLTIDEIKPYVDRYILHAIKNPNKIYLTTEIGCGLAGLIPKQVAPLFQAAINVENIHLPARFWRVLAHYMN